MRKIVITLVILALGTGVFFGVRYFQKNDLEEAIGQFEDGDYVDAIVMLNGLLKTADYDTSEKIHYYRCRSINGLARKLEKRYDDELREASLENSDKEEFEKAKRKIEKKLKNLNEKTGGDLAYVPGPKQGRIVPRGQFYDEFTSRFRGSSLIEDLQFEEIENVGRSDPEKQIGAVIDFYRAHPNTTYLSQIVRVLFDSLKTETVTFSDRSDILWSIIVTYVKKYPTSSEMNRLYRCTGNNVNLRNSPGIEGKLVGKIKEDEILIQIEKSMDTSQIGDVRDYWYMVANLSGLRGWIFGKFLKQVDPSDFKGEDTVEVWSFEEDFSRWIDSNTPENWIHAAGKKSDAIGFTAAGDRRVAFLKGAKGEPSGLFNRFTTSRAFTLVARARHTGGGPVSTAAYSLGNGTVFQLVIAEEAIEISGRKIPAATSMWHEYRLESDDGRFASLSIDGEVVAGRIKPENNSAFTLRGIYCLYSDGSAPAGAEIDFLKIR